MTYDFIIIGEKVAAERKKHKWSQTELIEELAEIGVHISRNKLSEFEHGTYSDVSLSFLSGLCKLFDCDMGYLLGEKGYENKNRQTTDIVRATGLTEDAVNELQDFENINRYPEFYSFISLLIADKSIKKTVNEILDQFCAYYQAGKDCRDQFNHILIDSIMGQGLASFGMNLNLLNELIKTALAFAGKEAKDKKCFPNYRSFFLDDYISNKCAVIMRDKIKHTSDYASLSELCESVSDLDILNRYGDELIEREIKRYQELINDLNYQIEDYADRNGETVSHDKLYKPIDEESMQNDLKLFVEELKQELSKEGFPHAE